MTKNNTSFVHKMDTKWSALMLNFVHKMGGAYVKFRPRGRGGGGGLIREFMVLYQTRETVFHQDIQTPRRELKIRRAAEYF